MSVQILITYNVNISFRNYCLLRNKKKKNKLSNGILHKQYQGFERKKNHILKSKSSEYK